MHEPSNVVDIRSYRNAPGPPARPGRSPLRWMGWSLSVCALGFILFAAYRSADLGVFNEVVAGSILLSGLVAATGACVGTFWKRPASRQATTAAEAPDAAAPVSIAAFRRRSPFGSSASVTCESCGASYAPAAAQDACPDCGRVARTA